jgi:hypothetical protein
MSAEQRSSERHYERASILAERLERWIETDLAAIVAALRGADPAIRCGLSDPDPRTEQRIATVRDVSGFASNPEGCGRLMVLWNAFRCVECARWFHRSCIERHFEQHRTRAEPADRRVATEEPTGDGTEDCRLAGDCDRQLTTDD